MSSVSLQLPDHLQKQAAAQAKAAGMTLNEYIITALAARVGSQAEAERYFAARAARITPGQAREILARAGQRNSPQPGDELNVEDVPA